MKKNLALFFVLSLSLNLSAQKKLSSQDSIKVFYDGLFSTLEKGYLLKNDIDWTNVETATKNNLVKYSNFKSSLNEIIPLFEIINAPHCIVYSKEKTFSIPTDISVIKFSDQLKKKFATKPGFETKIIGGKYGYILIPAMNSLNNHSKFKHEITQPLYDQISKIKSENKIEGWIIDLRFNLGGNCELMLLPLYDLLGNNQVWGTMNVNKKQTDKVNLKNGNYYNNSFKSSYINTKGKLLDKAKVAVITGALTGSSGEVTAISFKGRPNTTFIGEPTLGYTSTNMGVNLPFDIKMALTIGYDCDRNGVYYERIVPDIAVYQGDNFDNLLLDKNIQEAIKFINKKG